MDYEYELWQDGIKVAAVVADNEADARREMLHYAAIYGQDGPYEIRGPIRRRASQRQ